MNKEEYEKHKPFAGEKKPSMLRRRVGHDYESRRMYLITMTVEGRRPLLGRLAGRSDAPEGSADWPHVELSELGEKVRERWYATEQIYPEIKVVALQIMPDHLHGILFVRERMAQHLGKVIKGFKAGCNKAYRELVLGLPANGAATRLQQRQPSSSSLQPVCYAATTLQPHTHPSQHPKPKDDRTHGYLWSRGYNDHILSGKDELQRWLNYLRTNPLRLAIKREHPDLFRVRFGLTIAGQTYAAIGNQFLLSAPQKLQVQLPCLFPLPFPKESRLSCAQPLMPTFRSSSSHLGASMPSPNLDINTSMPVPKAASSSLPHGNTRTSGYH